MNIYYIEYTYACKGKYAFSIYLNQKKKMYAER